MACFSWVLNYWLENFVRNYDFLVSRLSQLFKGLEGKGTW